MTIFLNSIYSIKIIISRFLTPSSTIYISLIPLLTVSSSILLASNIFSNDEEDLVVEPSDADNLTGENSEIYSFGLYNSDPLSITLISALTTFPFPHFKIVTPETICYDDHYQTIRRGVSCGSY
jgi:hypothetical protein